MTKLGLSLCLALAGQWGDAGKDGWRWLHRQQATDNSCVLWQSARDFSPYTAFYKDMTTDSQPHYQFPVQDGM